MVKILNKRFVAVFMTVIFSFLFILAGSLRADSVGSISVFLKTVENHKMEGAEIRLYKVADLTDKFTYTDEFSGCDADLKQVNNLETALKIYDYAFDKDISCESKITDSEGRVIFSDLELGIYLLCQGNTVDGFDDIAPFLVTVPKDGIYDVDASPKTVVTENVTVNVKKIWNDDGEKSRPKSITVALKKGDEVIEKVTLSKENQWKYSWKNIPASDKYSVEEINVPKGYVASYRNDGLDFIIENTPKLVQTGQLNWPVPVMATVGAFMVILGIRIGMKKDEKEKDNI